ncbi:MAG: hypothetical protein COW85_07100 [Ignavibacteria bacterium CG22_combo_CG10-13_8_21_14_all_37_15]|nr:hypothetical protein [Ignavibacteria bacterium]OIO15036.1 MAG: hypothetical protein AUJ54_13425 [Ignavibacteria bacterium CG1_02_37_35]PIP77803.1 MAG: hypothetical protein COW85_07100 [Ignavibacteria bacterium CG22_combo_CG10-13_8_21_14_all_37_15]PIS44399.1 MAG: hypothetical protein COT22_10740 [Ignavibacteria bacterium CG08_land_8_20_14_0_20_37_9]PIX93393.1 MAG: hypothetical protein COZ25_10915 [Ignavibacteria bacterium CG_4_10_14_3_um_filter_37_18]PJC58379.1 MAG: hypothetical protein CO02
MKKIGFFFILFFIQFGCLDISNPVINKDVQVQIPLGEEFILKYQKELKIEGTNLTIKFSAIPEDSRCPVDVVCVWAGNAHIVLLLNGSDNIDLNTTLPSNEASYMNTYKITLLEVQPLPLSRQQIPIEKYEVKLKVEKLQP